MASNHTIAKLKRALRNARDAWWVLLIIVGYCVFAWRFLGTSCLFASISGIPCPGCGGTRALVLLLRGDVAASMRYHPMLIPSAVFACVYFAVYLFCERRPVFMQKALLIFTVTLLCVYALRMAFLFPDTLPMVINRQAVLPRAVFFISSLLR